MTQNTPQGNLSKPRRLANLVADCVQSGIVILFWASVAAAGIGAVYIVFHAIMWIVKLASQALGL